MKKFLTITGLITFFATMGLAQQHPDSLYFDLDIVLKKNLTTAEQNNLSNLRQQLNAQTIQRLPKFNAERWMCRVRKNSVIRIQQGNQVIETTSLRTAEQAEIEAVGIICRSGTSEGVSENPASDLLSQVSSTTNQVSNMYTRPQDILQAGNTQVKIALFDTGIQLTQANGKWIPTHTALRELFPNGEVLGSDFTNPNGGIPQDLNGHGTFVAGIVHKILKANGGLRLLPNGKPAVQVYIYKILDNQAKGSEWSFMAAMSQAIDEGMDIVNCSFIVQQPSTRLSIAMESPMKMAANLIKDNKILMSVAAGNNGLDVDTQLFEPTMYKNINMLVSGSTNAAWGNKSVFANYGRNQVDVFARGEEIISTYLNNTYRSWKGSSFAAPQTTAWAALLLTNACATGDRVATNRNVRKAIVNTVDMLNAPDWLSRSCASQGVINPAQALIRFKRINSSCLSGLSKVQKWDTESEPTWNIFPNPFETGVRMDLESETNEIVTIQWINMLGHVLLEEKIALEVGDNSFSLSSDVPKGMYLLSVKGATFDSVKRIVKQ